MYLAVDVKGKHLIQFNRTSAAYAHITFIRLRTPKDTQHFLRSLMQHTDYRQ